MKIRMNKYKIYIYILIVLIVSVFLAFSGCRPKGINYPPMIDSERIYEEVGLTMEQKTMYPHCVVENCFVSDEYRIFRVVSKRGYIDEIEMLILINGTVIERIVGITVKESEEYGAKCFNASYLEQFSGIDLHEIPEISGKATPSGEGEVIYLTHATVTSKAVIAGVNAAAAVLRELGY